ncbi:MAG TPA: ATPase domain-containing protein, partial [Methanocella sp.]|nr:ATPase domain-containing protein [Methanocella sp.]
LNEVGAGGVEFTYTSMLMLAQKMKEHAPPGPSFWLPEKIVYISFTKVRENVLQSVSTLNVADLRDVEAALTFVDLSRDYFAKTKVPRHWTTTAEMTLDSYRAAHKIKPLFESLIETLEALAPGNLVIIDSLTDLMRGREAENLTWNDVVSLLKGVERMSKRWNTTIYALLTANIFPPSMEEEVADCADGVLVFGWGSTGNNQRQRTMYIKKFRGLMPYLEDDNVVRFETRVSATLGFEVSNVREIIGR